MMIRIRTIGVVVLSLLLVSLACNLPFEMGGLSEPGPLDEDESDLPSGIVIPENLEPGSTFILVVDPSGDPIPNARVSDTGLFTDWHGVAVGVVSTTASGWFSVHAPGFASTYTRAITEWDGYPLALTILSPLGPAALVEEDATTTLTIENSRREQAQIHLNAGSFTELQVLLSWSDIPLTQLDARFGDLSEMEDLSLQGAFALEAISLEGEALDLQPDGSVLLNITWDPERNEIPVLGSFNSTSGSWELLDEYCQLSDEVLMTCTLPHLSEFGLFGHSSGGGGWEDDDEGEGDDFSSSFGSSLDNAMGGGAGGAAGGGGAAGNGGGDEGGGSGGGLTGGLDGISGSGEGLGTEVDKMTALIAAGVAMENGLDGLANQYLDQARNAIIEMAEDMLKDPRCQTGLELGNLASQAMLVGGLENLASQLINKMSEIFDKCVVWRGSIKYMFFFDATWPQNPDWILEKGTAAWIETHDVLIAIEPESGAIDGESHVSIIFPTSTYRKIVHTVCGDVHNDHDMDTNPPQGKATLIFDGAYDGNTFSIGTLSVSESTPVAIAHHAWLSQSYPLVPPKTCPGPITEEISWRDIAEYTSQLIHGFMGKPEPPSIQDMLNTGMRGRFDDGREWIRGSQDLLYSPGTNMSPLIPISSGSVTWEFSSMPIHR